MHNFIYCLEELNQKKTFNNQQSENIDTKYK